MVITSRKKYVIKLSGKYIIFSGALHGLSYKKTPSAVDDVYL